jgi:hypothetical protein
VASGGPGRATAKAAVAAAWAKWAGPSARKEAAEPRLVCGLQVGRVHAQFRLSHGRSSIPFRLLPVVSRFHHHCGSVSGSDALYLIRHSCSSRVFAVGTTVALPC